MASVSTSAASIPPLGCQSLTNACKIAWNCARSHGVPVACTALAARCPLYSSSRASANARSHAARARSGSSSAARPRAHQSNWSGGVASRRATSSPAGSPAMVSAWSGLISLRRCSTRSRYARPISWARLPTSAIERLSWIGAIDCVSSVTALHLPDPRREGAPFLASSPYNGPSRSLSPAPLVARRSNTVDLGRPEVSFPKPPRLAPEQVVADVEMPATAAAGRATTHTPLDVDGPRCCGHLG